VRYNDIKFVISLLSIKLSGKRDTVTTDGGGDNTDNHPAIAPKMALRVGGQLFGVRLPISNFKF